MIEKIKTKIKEGIMELLLEEGEIKGQVDIYEKDSDGQLITSLHFREGRLVKVYTIESDGTHTYGGELSVTDVQIKKSFCFIDGGDVLLFTYHEEDDYFTIDDI